ncbi:MAG: DMT family transporter [Spirochaetes bacterium]|nr:DMT family transporter [Spirochaetota bacterium]
MSHYKSKPIFSISLLVIATMFWGSTFAFTKELTTVLNPLPLIFIRFTLTGILMFFLFFSTILKTIKQLNRSTFFWLLLLGMINFGAILFQTAGLTEISASNSGFITSLSILFIPIIEFFIRKKKIFRSIRIAIVLSLAGIYLLSYGFHLPQGFIRGDLMTLCSALCYAFYIIVVDILSKKVRSPSLMFFVFFITSIISLPFLCFVPLSPAGKVSFMQLWQSFTFWDFFNLFFLVIGGTVIPYLLMGVGQRYLDAQRSAIIYLLEPVFALVIAVLFFGEILYSYKIIGGGIILLAQFLVIYESNQILKESGISIDYEKELY